ncbi:nickel-dependent hydrogenase large subunit [Candidatus Bathyarchaeota archaeon]|nr:nickel-dependent hydrogenase large subunit [Candidatus Bathyarchaeota archaeon]
MHEKVREISYSRFVIPVGPVHPALKEPVHFKVTLQREEVVDVDLRIGYAHRGIEALAQTRNLIQTLYLVERICGICSHSHATCFVQAIEEIGGIQPSERVLYLRTLIAELERIHSHILWLGVMAHEIGFDTLFMFALRAREKVMDLFEEITGNRVHHSLNTIGGVRSDLTPHSKEKIVNYMKDIKKATHYMLNVFQDKTVEKRLVSIGVLSQEDARRLCVVGPTARGSGVKIDTRKDDPYAAYEDFKNSFSVVVRTKGDAYTRTEVRLLEILESVNIINSTLDQLPSGPIAPVDSVLKLVRKIPEGEAVSRVEAPRGELLYFVKTDGKESLDRLKVRTPTLANIISLKTLLIGREVADIPVIVASIDPCISCTDR